MNTYEIEKNEKLFEKQVAFLESLNTARKTSDLTYIFSKWQLHKVCKSWPGANLVYASDFENAPHFTLMNAHKLLFHANCYFLQRCSAPSCIFHKARCSVWCSADRLHPHIP